MRSHGRLGLRDQLVAEGFDCPLHARDALLSESHFICRVPDIHVVLSPAQHAIHQLRQLADRREDDHPEALAPGEIRRKAAPSALCDRCRATAAIRSAAALGIGTGKKTTLAAALTPLPPPATALNVIVITADRTSPSGKLAIFISATVRSTARQACACRARAICPGLRRIEFPAQNPFRTGRRAG